MQQVDKYTIYDEELKNPQLPGCPAPVFFFARGERALLCLLTWPSPFSMIQPFQQEQSKARLSRVFCYSPFGLSFP